MTDKSDVKNEKEALSPHQKPPETELPDMAAKAMEEVATYKEEAAAHKDKYVRLLAEFDNMRKRHDRERAELIKYAHEEVIIECLKLYDDLQRSLAAFKAKEGIDANLVKGLEMVYKNLKELMDRYEVKPIEVKGKPFDHQTQEVLMQEANADFPDGMVMEELERGYTLGGRVVRTAKVKVAKNIK